MTEQTPATCDHPNLPPLTTPTAIALDKHYPEEGFHESYLAIEAEARAAPTLELDDRPCGHCGVWWRFHGNGEILGPEYSRDHSWRPEAPVAPPSDREQARDAVPLDRLIDGLAWLYRSNPPQWRSPVGLVGELCDEHLDRSGALLDKVRDRSRALDRLPPEPGA